MEPDEEPIKLREPVCDYCKEPGVHCVQMLGDDYELICELWLCDSCDDGEIAAWESEY